MNFNKKIFHKFGLITGIAIALIIIFFTDFGEGNQNAKIVAAIAVLMSIYWITSALPLGATSLIPLVLFPLLGILSGKETANSYVNSTIFLFIGGFIIALAMEKWNLHKRIAIQVISIFGKTPSTIILGFMIAAAFLSMWISNTATAVMMLPIGLAILKKMEEEYGAENVKSFSKSLMLSIAYASSIGGVATFIGTPPNLVFKRIYAISFPNNPEILFSQWMMFGVPFSIIMLVIVWLILTKLIYKPEPNIKIDRTVTLQEKKELGKMLFEEKTVFAVFIFTALLWIFRKDIDLNFIIIPGWSNIFSKPNLIDDGTVAILMSLVLFMIPAKNKKEMLIDKNIFKKIPWEIILLFGGGFALADGFIKSGLSNYIGGMLGGLANIPLILLVGIVSFSILMLTELTSNTATSQIILPILAVLSIQLNINPLLLMIPATVSASMAFMMPIATPPNAIVFGSDRLEIIDMIKSGVLVNLIVAIIITFSVFIVM